MAKFKIGPFFQNDEVLQLTTPIMRYTCAQLCQQVAAVVVWYVNTLSSSLLLSKGREISIKWKGMVLVHLSTNYVLG